MTNRKRKRDETDIIKKINSTPFSSFVNQVPLDTTFVGGNVSYLCTLHMTKKSKIVTEDTHKLTDIELDQCLALVEGTSRQDYEASSIGWHPQRKRREMLDKDMRYVIVRRAGSDFNLPIEGFISFMFTYEAGKPVVYIYEIHLRKDARGCGLGKHLLNLVHRMGAKAGVEESMLTVFKSNASTLEWYFRAGYAVDDCSPPDKRLRGEKTVESDYLILSKTGSS